MNKPKYVYHGSGKKLEGNKLIPKKPADLGEKSDNKLVGVYASDVKEEAIAMGILSTKGVGSSSCGVHRKRSIKVEAIIYDGWPQQSYFYLYTLSSVNFESRPKGSHQWVSLKPVTPVNIERLLINDYTHLIRRATEGEKKKFFGKYKHKIPSVR